MRLWPPSPSGPPSRATEEQVEHALLAHLCRCTGWQTIEEAATSGAATLEPASRRTPPTEPGPRSGRGARADTRGWGAAGVGPDVVLGRGRFADDTAPPGAGRRARRVGRLRGGRHRPAEARAPGRQGAGPQHHRGTAPPGRAPPGDLGSHLADHLGRAGVPRARRLVVRAGRRAGVALGNGGAFGGKLHSPVAADARAPGRRARSAGPGRSGRGRTSSAAAPSGPPVAAGVAADGTGVLAGGPSPPGSPDDRWASVVAEVAGWRPGSCVEQVRVPGPPVSFDLRAAVWAEAAIAGRVRAGALGRRAPVVMAAPGRGDRARPAAGPVATLPSRRLGRGGGRCRRRPLDEVVLRSYCIGAAHQALGWVRSRGHRRGRRRRRSRPDHPVLRHPPGPGHAPGVGDGADGRRWSGRSTAPTRCSPRWPAPAGSPTGSRPCGRPGGGRLRRPRSVARCLAWDWSALPDPDPDPGRGAP